MVSPKAKISIAKTWVEKDLRYTANKESREVISKAMPSQNRAGIETLFTRPVDTLGLVYS